MHQAGGGAAASPPSVLSLEGHFIHASAVGSLESFSRRSQTDSYNTSNEEDKSDSFIPDLIAFWYIPELIFIHKPIKEAGALNSETMKLNSAFHFSIKAR